MRVFILCGACAFLLACGSSAGEIQPASDTPQPMTPEESAAAMRLPEGFRIELVASEPLIQEPSCMAFDERGRLFVCELHGYNIEGHLDVRELNKTGKLDTQVRRLRWELMGGKIAEEAAKLQYGLVKLLTDSDGDGRMDQADVWADDLPPCYGVVPARGGIIVVAAPDIVFLADRDGDGKPEVRQTLYTGFRTRMLERGINNPRWGLDNWIYVGAGGEGGTIRGPYLDEPVELAHTDFRIKADGSALEPVNGRVGTYGLAINANGDRFPCSGGQPAIYALPLPYHYLTRNPFVPTPAGNHSAANYSRGFRISQPHPWRVRRQQDPAWVKFYGSRETDSNYFTGGCGGEIYLAELFPQSYRGNFFYCEPSLNIIHRCVLERDHAGYRAQRAAGEEDAEFLASTDQWFRPINLRTGPDGALYIVDMYREIIEDYSAIPRFLQQQYGLDKGSDKGRIWRLLPSHEPYRAPIDLAQLGRAEQVALTTDSNFWRRITGQRLIVEAQDTTVTQQLAQQVKNGKSPPARLHALYTLHGLGTLTAADVSVALGDQDAHVRLHALRLADEWLSTDEKLLARILSLSGDKDPSVRLQLAMTLGDTPHSQAVSALLELGQQFGTDRWMVAAILSSSRDIAGQLLQGLLSDRDFPDNAQPLLAPLAATVAGRRDGESMDRVLSLIAHADVTIQQRCLQGLVDGLSHGSESIPEPTPEFARLSPLLKSESPDVIALAVQIAGQLLPDHHQLLSGVFADAAVSATDPEQSLERRTWAISLLADAPHTTLSDVARQLLDHRQPPALQHAAVAALDQSDQKQGVELLLLGWPGFTPDTRKLVLKTIISRENRWPVLLDAIEEKVIRPGDLNDSQREQLTEGRNREIVARAQELLKNASAGAELQPRIDEYQQALGGKRDLELGKQVFTKNCLTCHKLHEEGHDVGPPLGSVINKPDEAILLDLLDPSGHIESDYTNYIVATHDGRTLTGVLASESPTSVTLRLEKGETVSVLRREIELMKASTVSLMPSNLHEQLRPADVANLIAFLRHAYSPE